MSTDETQTASEAVEPAQPAETPPSRLVIRVKIAREDSLEPLPPAQLDKSALAAAIGLGVIVLVAIVWVLTRVFGGDAVSTPAASVVPSEEASRSLAPVPTPNDAAVPAHLDPVAPEVEEQPDVPPSPINEVIPDVPQSALQTIRGTVRVAIRVVIGQDGTVVGANSEIPGPSRYFERISLQAAKDWVFTRSDGQDNREMLVRFYFRRDGVTAGAEPFGGVDPIVSDGPSPPPG